MQTNLGQKQKTLLTVAAILFLAVLGVSGYYQLR